MTTNRLLTASLLALITACGKSKMADPPPPTPLPPNPAGHSCTAEMSTCPQPSLDAYATCVVKACDAKYQMCLGAGYASGTFGQPCKSWIECGRACANCDQACLKACSDMYFVGDCKSCVAGPIADCVLGTISAGTCKLPCVTIGAGCAGLQACCDSLVDASDKKSCQTSLDQVKGLAGDIACDPVLNGYKQSGKCSGVNMQPPTMLPGPKPTMCSMGAGAAATIHFVNMSAKSITTWWIDPTCTEKKYVDIAAGASFDQGTFVGHAWRIRDTATLDLLKEVPPLSMPGLTTITYP